MKCMYLLALHWSACLSFDFGCFLDCDNEVVMHIQTCHR